MNRSVLFQVMRYCALLCVFKLCVIPRQSQGPGGQEFDSDRQGFRRYALTCIIRGMLPFLLLFQRFVTNLELFIFCFLYTIIFVYFGKNTFILMQIVSLIKAYIYLVVDLFIDVEFIFFSLNI